MSNRSHPRRWPRAVLFSALCAAYPVLAAEVPPPEDVPENEAGETGVDAPRVQPIEVWGTSVRSSTQGLDDEALHMREADHVSDLLRTLPGVDVGGAHSLNQRITIRSLGDRDLRISIDGANQNSYMYHHMGNLQIHADILKAVEIEVGNNSVATGSLGGAVRFETRSARELLQDEARLGARLHGGYADNDGSSASVTAYGLPGERIDLLAYFNRVERGNYEVGGGRILDANGDLIPGTDGKVRGIEGDLSDGLFKAGWELAPGQRLELGLERYEDEGDYSYRPDMGLATQLAISGSLRVPLTYPTRFDRDTWTLGHRWNSGNGTELRTTAYRNDSQLWRDERGLAPWRPAAATINQGDAVNTGVNLIGRTAYGDGEWRHELVYGAEQNDYDTAYRVDGVRLAGESASTLGVYLQDTIRRGGFSLTPGLRFDGARIDSAVVEDHYDGITHALAAGYEFDGGLRFGLSRAQLFQAPEIGEVFIGAGLYDVANPGIEAEGGRNEEAQLGWRGSFSGEDAVALNLTVFRTRINEFVYQYAPNPAGGTWADNVGDMRVRGFEAGVEYGVGAWDFQLSYDRARSALDASADYVALDGARIDRQQGDSFGAALGWTNARGDLRLGWEALAVDDVAAGPDLDGATLRNAKDGYTVHNLSLRWDPSWLGGMRVGLNVENAFDEFYASQSSRTGVSRHPRFGELYLLDYEPGRNVKLSLSYLF